MDPSARVAGRLMMIWGRSRTFQRSAPRPARQRGTPVNVVMPPARAALVMGSTRPREPGSGRRHPPLVGQRRSKLLTVFPLHGHPADRVTGDGRILHCLERIHDLVSRHQRGAESGLEHNGDHDDLARRTSSQPAVKCEDLEEQGNLDFGRGSHSCACAAPPPSSIARTPISRQARMI